MHLVFTANSAWNLLNFRSAIIEEAHNRKWRTTVLAPSDGAVAELEKLGCVYVPFEMDAKGLNVYSEILTLTRMYRELRRLRPTAVLSYTIKNNIYSAFAGRRLGIPVIPNVSGLGRAFDEGSVLTPLAERLYRLSFKNVSTAFVQNPDDQDVFLQRNLIAPERLRLLPGSGVDLNKFTPLPLPGYGTQTTFILVARMLWDKGISEYVEAARRLRKYDPNLRFQLLGGLSAGNRAAVDEDTLLRWVSEGAVEYLGSVDDVRPHMAAADCVVLPSFYREGVPRSLLEAGAMARPIVTTNMPGCRHAVDHGLTGYICEPRDAASLANAMQAFVELDPAARSAMGQAGRKKIEAEFDQQIVVDAYMDAVVRATGKT